MDKTYIEEQYRLAVLDYKIGLGRDDENMKFDALRTMARLEQIALQNYGCDYVDSLQTLKS